MAAAPSGGLDAADIITQATMATTLVKMLVDMIKLCWGGDGGHPPSWVPPIASLVSGIGVLALLAVALGQDLAQSRLLASTVLAGLMAAVGAIGVTELHKLARQPGVEKPQMNTDGHRYDFPPHSNPPPVLEEGTGVGAVPGGAAGNWRT